ncbi:MAG: hypothetical protein IPK82_44145 [Polyangiaceae bacterium]|nr:hypothetical protein [Polyangiaceae bacterium]
MHVSMNHEPSHLLVYYPFTFLPMRTSTIHNLPSTIYHPQSTIHNLPSTIYPFRTHTHSPLQPFAPFSATEV